jgi:hypothetical protein
MWLGMQKLIPSKQLRKEVNTMREPKVGYDTDLLLLGKLLKFLFIGIFVCTVLVVLASIFGAGEDALLIYQLIWGFFWRICIALMAFISVLVLYESL